MSQLFGSESTDRGHSIKQSSVDARFEAFDRALRTVGPKGAPGLEIIGGLKAVWSEVRNEAVELNRIRGGRFVGVFMAGWADRILARVLLFAARRVGIEPDRLSIAVLALGSLGRQEMALYSDWDLLILHCDHTQDHDPQRLEKLVGQFLRLLWDSGINLGHSVRTPEECLGVMFDGVHGSEALETATSLLEARFVTGDESIADAFLKRTLPEFFREHGRPFVDAKMVEALQRHERQGATIYHTQPNLKEHPGSLRDYQLSVWIDQASKLSGHLPRLDERPLVSREVIDEAESGYNQILTLRIALHAEAGRKQEVLDHHMQQAVAASLGYEGTEEQRASELLLKDYYHAASAVFDLADRVIRRYREEQALASQDIDQLRRRPIDRDFTRIGDRLYASRVGILNGPDWMGVAMRAFLLAGRLNVGISQEIREGIRERLPDVTEEDRRDPNVARPFLQLLSQRTNVGRTLRAMRDVGLLSEYIPEYGEICDLVVQDVFHDFTVDEHTLFVVENVDRLYLSGDTKDRFRRELLEKLPYPEILKLAALFHDLGKSRGAPGHSQRGALMVPLMAERLGLSESNTRKIIFLVENHLVLSHCSLRRDPGEGQLLDQLAQKIKSQERLDLLYLLTCADILAVGKGAFPNWKEEQLKELHGRLSAILSPTEADGSAVATSELSGLHARVITSGSALDSELAREHFSMVPQRYRVEVDEDEALLHLSLLQTLKDTGQAAVASAKGGGPLVDIWVVSANSADRFYRICGAFLGRGVNVVSALTYTRKDGIVLDRFRVSVALEYGVTSREADAELWGKVARDVEEALASKEIDFRARIDEARRRIPRSPQVSMRIHPEVRIDNKLSDRHTVVDVICGDRIGLLYGLSRALADLGCQIHFSKVDTNQGRATDVFYITGNDGGKILDSEKAFNIKLLLMAVAADFQSARR